MRAGLEGLLSKLVIQSIRYSVIDHLKTCKDNANKKRWTMRNTLSIFRQFEEPRLFSYRLIIASSAHLKSAPGINPTTTNAKAAAYGIKFTQNSREASGDPSCIYMTTTTRR